ncbi:DUF1007 family protein [Pseudooceanicola sp.]|uniref:DUF1007 family protein n=1 Tax=Pseudooceanicola sp. TaxID=1914328 RepID=UPI004057DBDF
MHRHLRTLLSAALCATLSGGAVQAHPHVFVDTTLRIETDAEGRPVAVEVTWLYDELYSLLIFEDMGLDSDYDGALTPEELAQLDGFDMQWIPGFAGDLYLSGGAGPIRLGPPEPQSTRVEGGRIETVHRRPLASPGPETIVLRAYDPTYYTAYDLTGGVSAPEGCSVQIAAPDLDAAQARVETELDGRPETVEDFPEVGDAFADTVTLRCGTGG